MSRRDVIKTWIRVSAAEKKNEGQRQKCFLVEEGCFSDVFDVLVEGEVAVEDDSKVVAVRGGNQGGVVNGEVEVLGCLGEGSWTNWDHV